MTTRSAIYSGTAAPLRARADWKALADCSGPTPGRRAATRRAALWLGAGIQPRRLAAGPVAGQEPARPLSNPTPGPGASPATRRGARSRATARDRSAPGPQLSDARALRKRKPGPQNGGDSFGIARRASLPRRPPCLFFCVSGPWRQMPTKRPGRAAEAKEKPIAN
jgi:hypothetical protein